MEVADYLVLTILLFGLLYSIDWVQDKVGGFLDNSETGKEDALRDLLDKL